MTGIRRANHVSGCAPVAFSEVLRVVSEVLRVIIWVPRVISEAPPAVSEVPRVIVELLGAIGESRGLWCSSYHKTYQSRAYCCEFGRSNASLVDV